ncbi:hypothetical protein E3J79_02125 [Candidatus Dependentiae bacterium]|nr:MAG: hypothetical protein E3J79_02125 [Candidatus Dependentiae bacterium]
MNKSNNILRAVVITTILVTGIHSTSVSARSRNNSLQSKYRGALRIALIGGKGFITVYSAYKALLESTEIIKIFQALIKHPVNRSLAKFDDLLYLGCITCGLGMLAYTTGNSCLHDLE